MNSGALREAYTAITPENAGETLYTRCERETLMRFPKTNAILFTIRTYLRPLAWYAARPTECATLAEALRQLPDDMVRLFQPNVVMLVALRYSVHVIVTPATVTLFCFWWVCA